MIKAIYLLKFFEYKLFEIKHEELHLMIKWEEIDGNLFDYEKTHYLAHCVSSDFKLGKGIATQFNERYDLKAKLLDKYQDIYQDIWKNQNPLCDLTEFEDTKGVFSLITKNKYFQKPTYNSLRKSLEEMKIIVLQLISKTDDTIKIAMPQIGSGLDKLEWNKVKDIVLDVFGDVKIELLFVYFS